MHPERVRAPLAVIAFALAACRGADLNLGDGNPDAGRATAAPTLEFGEPHVVEGLSAGDGPDDDPSLSADGLLLCFNSKRDGGMGHEDVWCATRPRTDAAFDPPQPLATLNSEARETGIALSADGLSLWFSSDRDGGDGGLDVYVTHRASRQAPWPTPERVAELSTQADDLVSAVDQSERTLVLARRANEDDDYDILIAQRDAEGQAWGQARVLDAIDTDAEESDGFLVGDGRQLLFTRDRDLMFAERAGQDQAFDYGTPIDALNSEADDRDPWANSTLTHVLFSSNRDGAYRIYEAQR